LVSAHPDDETFGCGGTLSLQSQRGNEVYILCLTSDPKEREHELIEASKILGTLKPIILMDKKNYVKQ
jgi:LmbE family N-acetylglucosaminyl deacetylase